MHLLIADDHDLLRDSLRAFLTSAGDFEVSEAGDFASAMALACSGRRFDLILLDYSMPGMDGCRGLEAMLRAAPDTPVAVISGAINRALGRRTIDRGAAGFIPKTLPASALVEAIRTMIGGGRYEPGPEWPDDPDDAAKEELSRRETQVIALLGEGLTNRQIAERLGLQEVTVKLHVKTLCRKIGARNRTHAALIGQERGLA